MYDSFIECEDNICRDVTQTLICSVRELLRRHILEHVYVLEAQQVLESCLRDPEILNRLSEKIWICVERFLRSSRERSNILAAYIAYGFIGESRPLLIDHDIDIVNTSSDLKLFLRRVCDIARFSDEDIKTTIILSPISSMIFNGVVYPFNPLTLERDYILVELIDPFSSSSKIFIERSSGKIFEYYIERSHVYKAGDLNKILRVSEDLLKILLDLEKILNRDLILFWFSDHNYKVFIYALLEI
ncbi:MAG: hypothetical protein QXU60_05540 [Sulfolobales archaeon]